MKKIIPIVIVVLGVVAGGGWAYHKYHDGKKPTLTLYGNVDIREVTLGFRVPGKLAKLLYDEGDKVKAGEVIASLDDEPYRNQVANAEAQVESLRERLKLRETGNRPEEIAQARSLVREREATATNAERLFKRSEELLAVKGVAIQDRDNAAASYQEAEARLKSARDNLALLEAGFRGRSRTSRSDTGDSQSSGEGHGVNRTVRWRHSHPGSGGGCHPAGRLRGLHALPRESGLGSRLCA